MRKVKAQRNRSVLPLAVSRWRLRLAILALALLGLGAGLWAAIEFGPAKQIAQSLSASMRQAVLDAGFTVQSITVTGREQTGREEFMRALGVARGAPILAVDLAAAHKRIAALPWVAEVRLSRVLPDTIQAELVERRPVAIWQRDREMVLVDGGGTVITAKDVPKFKQLQLIVGKGAPRAAQELISLLASEPRLQKRVAAAIRVGERRWNIRLHGGIDVRLPEINPAAAWRQLALYEQSKGLLGRDVEIVDLRLPNQVVVRLTQGAVKRALMPDLDTRLLLTPIHKKTG